MKNLIYISIISGLLLFSCNGKQTNTESQDINSILAEETNETELAISEESMNDIIQSLPSPLEIATLIKESGIRFNKNFLNPTENADNYSTDTDKALAMGIYSGDLGYINIYEKSTTAISYLGTVKKIADDLKIGQFFDIELIKRIASNSKKLDSLLYISTISFEKMDRYLREQKRSKLSVLLVTGTWLESVYLATEVVNNAPNKDLFDRIAEQKTVLDQILLIVSAYEADPFFDDLNQKLNKLKAEYDKVTIEYNYVEPETKEVNGRLVIVDNSTTTVKMTDEQLFNIRQIIKQIRTDIISSS
ncbi:MAG TPA: hypothetical protein VJ951_12295 [Bacteroidales bacterium]|nr:hypothetical protein [Bacteroidales bacterium]